jgi:Cd2+/Zn2+-exporting ATPase
MKKKDKKLLIRIIAAAVLLVLLNVIKAVPGTGPVRFALFLIPYLVIGYDILIKAGKGIINGRMLDENFLMALATVGVFALDIYNKTGDYNEAIAVMLFYQTGELFEHIAVGKSRKNIAELMDIRPDYANIEKDGKLEKVSPDEVAVGTVITVCPGEKVPIDGIVEEGGSTLNTSALTGESAPVSVACSDTVQSGCVNLNGLLKIRTTKAFGESTASKILELVENASSRKSRSEAFISRFAKVYTPVVVGLALVLAAIVPLVRMLFGVPAEFDTWIYRALTFLVISCPCALVISVPLSFFAGLGGSSREGILIKGSNYLEALAHVKYVVLDKTGTITKGCFEVSGIHHNERENKEILYYAALAESSSTHPISISLKNAYMRAFDGEPDRSRVTDVEEISGCGVTATVDGARVAAGNSRLMQKLGVEYIDCSHPGTIVHVAINGKYEGHILISDTVKPTSAKALQSLKKVGTRNVMLTGDLENTAKKVAGELAIDEYYAGLLPDGKVSKVEELLAKKTGKETLAFVGDGINDAPVLSRADIGIAMGALGSDAAIEAADVVIMDDDLLKLPKGIAIAKKCMRIVYENIVFALAIKLACLILSAAGAPFMNMWYAIFADVGVMVLAVLNAIRALRVKSL